MIKTTVIFLWVPTVLISIVCASGCRSRNLAESSLEIYNGEEIVVGDSFESSFVELARVSKKLESSCSGTLIHKRVVLTAAHCFGPTVTAVTAYFGSNETSGAYKRKPDMSVPYNSENIYRHEDYKDGKAYIATDPDIALIRLPEDAPSRYLPAMILESTDTNPGIGDDIVMTGTGWTEIGDASNGRKLELPVVAIDTAKRNLTFKAREKGACSGDSGGGAFFNNKLIGILSASNCKWREDYTDKDISTDVMLIKPYRKWIDAALTKWGFSLDDTVVKKAGKKPKIATEKPTRLVGYINTTSRGDEYFVGVDSKNGAVTKVFPVQKFFPTSVFSDLNDCMRRKATHAISFDYLPDFEYYDNLDCVSAPGLLDEWRKIVSAAKIQYDKI